MENITILTEFFMAEYKNARWLGFLDFLLYSKKGFGKTAFLPLSENKATYGIFMEKRIASIHRVTKETDISLTLNLDGSGKCKTNTGIGFFDHMIDSFARHVLFYV